MTVADVFYERLTPIYDVVFGPLLQQGRERALALLNPRAGDRILEVGVGTGHDLGEYPPSCHVTAVDLSMPMLERARRKAAQSAAGSISLAQMDGTHLAFAPSSFDAVYAPHVLNVVPDPVAMGRELLRVCRPGGRVVFLNHFDGIPETTNLTNAIAGRLAAAFSVNWRINVNEFLRDVGAHATQVESVNVPRLSTVVLCQKISALKSQIAN
jgi:phosphatidylethanolamine/phosphatidyl-N-methylethanolamine N-methyltransferase